jgi:aldose 1-epimerase
MIRNRAATFAAILVLVLTSVPAFSASIVKKDFGTTAAGDAVDQYVLTNDSGSSVSILSYGGLVTNLLMPDKNGKLGDVVLGYDNLAQYENQSGPYFGALVGRYANRIAGGQFTLDDKHYALAVNNGPNHLHGGIIGYDKRIWKVQAVTTTDGPTLKLTLLDPSGCEGYPGNVNVTVIYSLTADNRLKIQYFATTDKDTPINLTHHSYFNFKDGGKTDILGHWARFFADQYTPVDDTSIPTGQIAPVTGTPIDFTTAKAMGQDLIAMGGTPPGYDHNLVLRNQTGKLAKAAEVYEPESGRFMEVWTTEPGMQFYSGNFLDGTIRGKEGITYNRYAGFALECQHYPDSPNQANFPSTILHPGDVYRQITEYRFFVKTEKPW